MDRKKGSYGDSPRSATFSEAVTLEKIVLNRATGFTLVAGSDAASVSLAGGMQIAPPTDDLPVTNVVAVPMNLSAAQAWQTPANTVLELRAPISSEGPTALDLSGVGRYAYYGTNTFTGSLYLTNGAHRVYTDTGAFGAANPGSTVDFRSSLGTSLWLGGTKIEKNFKLTKSSGNNAGGMSFAANTTNEFAGSFTAGANWTPGGSSRIVFSGGGTINSYFRPTSGTYVFTGKPMSIGKGYLLKSTHIFQVASNDVADVEMNQSTELWLTVPNAFKNRPDLTQDAAAVRSGVRRIYVQETWAAAARREVAKAAERLELPSPRVIALPFAQPVTVCGLTVTGVPANHSTSRMTDGVLERTSLYLVEKGPSRLLYATDTGGIPGDAARMVGIDHHIRTEGYEKRFTDNPMVHEPRPITAFIMEATNGDVDDDFRIFVHSSVQTVSRIVNAMMKTGRFTPPSGQRAILTHLCIKYRGWPAEKINAEIPSFLCAASDGLETVLG